jgi:hypothetical protein
MIEKSTIKNREKWKSDSRFSSNLPTGSKQRPFEDGRSQQKPVKVIVCPHCGQNNAAWGTRKYCNNDHCQKAEKRHRQALVDGLAKDFKKGVYANYKIFRELLPEPGNFQIDYDKALKKGFDEHAFYGTSITEQYGIWYKVAEYYFSISHKNNKRSLQIYKS